LENSLAFGAAKSRPIDNARDLLKALEKWAADDLRGVNAQIEFVLRQALSRRKGPGK
jgi:hypothetical protein